MNRLDLAKLEHAAEHATGYVAGWLCRPENRYLRQKIAAYRVALPGPGMAARRTILEALGPLPVPPGDRMEFLVEAVQTVFAVVDWVAVDRQVAEAAE